MIFGGGPEVVDVEVILREKLNERTIAEGALVLEGGFEIVFHAEENNRPSVLPDGNTDQAPVGRKRKGLIGSQWPTNHEIFTREVDGVVSVYGFEQDIGAGTYGRSVENRVVEKCSFEGGTISNNSTIEVLK